jgi:pimeloyl-ACP methyl ester carboxylesterase
LQNRVDMGLSRLADRLILFPTRERVSTGEAVRAIIPNTDLEMWIHRRSDKRRPDHLPKLYLLHFIGNASRAEWEHPIFLDLLAEHFDVEAWVLNYPGYGRSGGKATLKSLPAAASEAYLAVSQIARHHPLLVSGNSMGTSLALYLAARYPVKGLILQNPPPIQDMILNRYGWWNLWLIAGPIAAMVPRDLNSLLNAQKVRSPAIFFTSEKDLTVPPHYQNKIMNRYAGPHQQVLISGAGHNTHLPDELRPLAWSALQWLIEAVDARHSYDDFTEVYAS